MRDKYKFITYLVGAMQITAENDDGSSKREFVEKELLLRNIYPINPVTQEKGKTGLSTEDLKEKMKGWKASGNWELYREKSVGIWKGKDIIDEDEKLIHIMGDIDYVNISDWITFVLNEGDKPCGSFGECYGAVEHNKPIYLITKIAKKDLWDSLVQWIECSNGKIFENFSQYLNFIDEKYKLKRKEESKVEEEKK